MIAWRKFKLEPFATAVRLQGANDNYGSRNELEAGRRLTKLIIDIAGVVQSEYLSANCGRHADIILEVRHMLGQVFHIPVVEIDTPALRRGVAETITRLDLFGPAGKAGCGTGRVTPPFRAI